MRRIIGFIASALLQVLLFTILFLMPIYSSYIYSLLVIIGAILALAILSDDSKLSTSKFSWIILVLAIPVVGIVLYILFGQGHMTSYKKKVLENSRLRYSNKQKYKVSSSNLSDSEQFIIDYLDNMQYKTSYLHYGGEIECYMYGQEKFVRMIADFENATNYIHIEYFIMKQGILFDRLCDVLIKKAQQGVEVRIICDFVGGSFLNSRQIQKLKDNKIRFEYFNQLKINILSKLSNFRDHRKIVVIDGTIAYTGGFNVGDEYIDLSRYYGHWQDFHIRIENSSAVLDFETFFAQVWYYETRENLFLDKYYPKYDKTKINKETLVYPFIDGPDSEETFVRDVFVKMIMSAKKSIYIATPYLIPDNVIYDCLLIQASSGIDITIITPGLPDKKYVKLVTESYYNQLLKAGVKIYEYNGFLHSKKILVDDNHAIVGSANFDMRSFNLSFEICTYLSGGSIINEIGKTFDFEISESKIVSIEKLEKESLIKRVIQMILRLFAPLF